MSNEIVGAIGLGIMVLLIMSGLPVAYSMGLVAIAGTAYLRGVEPALHLLGMIPWKHTANYLLVCVPMFILMGYFAFYGGASSRLYYAAQKWVGHLPGGLAMATTVSCGLFAAICGSSIATAGAMGTVSKPEMDRYGYDKGFSMGCIASGATLGIMIPPSIIFIIYGILTEQSIGRLLISGIFPGLLIIAFYLGSIWIRAKYNPKIAPPAARCSWRERFSSLKEVGGVVVIFVLVMGGIYLGIFTPTEASALGALGAFVMTSVMQKFKRTALLSNIVSSLKDTVRITAMALFIVIGASMFSYFLAISGLPFALAKAAVSLPVSPYVVLSLILLVYIGLGCILDTLAMIILTIPIVFPVATALGFDPIWFGVLIVRMAEIGLVTPPVGMNVFVLHAVAPDVPMSQIFRGVIPFLVTDILTLPVLVAFPQISLFLPNMMFK